MYFNPPQVDYTSLNELELAVRHTNALKEELYEICDRIQKEVNRRIFDGILTRANIDVLFTRAGAMQVNVEELNGLFDLLYVDVEELTAE